MKFQYLIGVLGLTILLISCGEDVGSTRNKTKKPESTPRAIDGMGALTVFSGIPRDRGTDPLTYKEEIEIENLQTNPGPYRKIPDILLDDEGLNQRSVLTQDYLGRPQVECGFTIDLTLDQRIADCADKNEQRATWDGFNNASSTEGIWSLVTFAGSTEIWIDRRTGMVWSDLMAVADWCKASGNSQPQTDEMAIVCPEVNVSHCSGKVVAAFPDVKWRLPTRNDYLQADLDGLRFVLKKDASGDNAFWTATIDSLSSKRSKAWVYKMDQGTLESQSLLNTNKIRCIGTPNRL